MTHLFLALTTLVLSAMILLPSHSLAGEETDAVSTYQKNRRAFVEKQRLARQSYDQDVAEIEKKIAALKQEIGTKKENLHQINRKIDNFKDEAKAAEKLQFLSEGILFPLASMTIFQGFISQDRQWLTNLKYIALAICVFNVGVYLLYRYRSMQKSRKIAIIVAMVVLICSISSPLLASDLENREELITNLELVGKVLSQSDHERFIAILESKPSGVVRVPALVSGDENFSVFREVRSGTPEYYSTLAALYTHEGMKGRTLESVKTMIKRANWSNSEDHQKMILNCISYLLQEQQTELVTETINSLIQKIGSTSVLLKLATILEDNGMRSSAEKVLGQAINKAKSVTALIELSDYLLGKGERDKGNRALDRAWQKVQSINEMLAVLKSAIKAGRDELVATIVEEADGSTFTLDELLRVVDLFLENQRKEEAITVFSKMIEDVNRHSRKKKDSLLTLIDAALSRSLLPQATNATNSLYLYLSTTGEDMTFTMKAGTRLKAAEGIPNDNKILLPQFFGLINEEQAIYDEAEMAYIIDVMNSLQQILDSYGYKLPESMNSFYLLGRTWVRENRSELLSRLDKVYTIIESQFINEQKQIEEQQLNRKQRELGGLQSTLASIQDDSSGAGSELSRIKRKVTFQKISSRASFVFIVAVLLGCFYLSYLHCRNLKVCRTFGFIMKFIETTGWLKVFCLLGLPSGLISIIVGQFFQIVQQNQENTHRIAEKNEQPKELTQVKAAKAAVTPQVVNEVAA